jgi:subtilase-type serine protease
MDVVLTALENLDDGDAANKAYDQIMPQDALGLADIIRNAMNQYSESIFGRMSNIRNSRQYTMAGDSRYLLASAGAAALPPKTGEWMPFAKVFGSWGDRDAESDIAGYKYDIYGLAGGIDKMVSDNTLIGISIAGSRANVDYSYSGTSSDIDSVFCSLYGSYFVDTWHIGVTLGYGRSWYDSKRGIPFMGLSAESDYQGNAYSAAVELGNNFGGTEMLLEPVVGLGYTAVQQDSYTEKGAGSLNLKVDSETTDGIYSKLGVRAAKEFRFEDKPNMRFVPNVSAFWIHDFADSVELDSAFIGGGSFTTEGLDPLRDTFNIGAGLNVYYNNNVRLFIDYGWQSESNFNSHTVQAGAQWSF